MQRHDQKMLDLKEISTANGEYTLPYNGTAPRISCYQINAFKSMIGVLERVQSRSMNGPEVVRQAL